MLSRTIMLMVIGQMRRTPAIPRGMSKVSAASGPYAAELRASSPNTGMPLAGPIRSALSSGATKHDVRKLHGILSIMGKCQPPF